MSNENSKKREEITNKKKNTSSKTKQGNSEKNKSTKKSAKTQNKSKNSAKPNVKPKTNNAKVNKVDTPRKKIERKKEEKPTIKSEITEEKLVKDEIELNDLDKNEPDLSKTIVLKISNDEKENTKINELELPTKEKKQKESKENDEVKTILGVDLPNGNNSEEKKERKHFYIKDALIFALIIPVIDLFAMLFIEDYTCILFTNNTVLNYVATLLIDFGIIFLVTYIIDYILGESSIKKSKK